MDPVEEARKLVRLAYHGEEAESRQQAALLAIAQALIAIAEELHEMNNRAGATAAAEQEAAAAEPVRFRGKIINHKDVLAAMRDFDAQYPDTNRYKQWLDNPTYKYAVCYEGKQYPPAHILRKVTKIRGSISGQANSVLRQLGFAVVPKPSRCELTMSSTTFGGITVTRQDILNALREFDDQYPDTNDFKNWLGNETYNYAVCHDGTKYPPKHILSEVTGISWRDFHGGKETNQVFKDLGFTVIDKRSSCR